MCARVWCLCLLSYVLATTMAWAQTSTATTAAATGAIRGVVRDEQGAMLPGVSVVATSTNGGGPFTAVSDAEGYYRLVDLPPGTYGITAEIQGFAKLTRAGIDLRQGVNVSLDLDMRVDAVREDVVVTAQKREERPLDVPVPVTVVGADTLAANSLVLLQEYYTRVPGLNLLPNFWGNNTITIRGVSTGAFSNPTVGVMVDDVAYSGSTGAVGNETPDFDPGDLARVEVLRGPQGTLYGANSMGGLLKFVTVDPSTAGLTGRVQVSSDYVHAGAKPGYNVRGAVNVPITGTLALRASGVVRRDPGYVDNPRTGRRDVNTTETANGRLSALWRPAPRSTVKLNASFQRANADGLAQVEKGPDLGDLQQGFLPGVGYSKKNYQAYSAVVNTPIHKATLTSVTGYNVNRYEDDSDFTVVFGELNQDLFGVGGAPAGFYARGTKFTQEVRLSIPLTRRADLLVGGFYTHEASNESWYAAAAEPTTGRVVGLLTSTADGATYNERSAFANLTYHFTDRFDVQLGGRESAIDQTTTASVATGRLNGDAPQRTPGGHSSANAFTYLITPRFKLTPDRMIYARFASGYRPGGSNSALCVTRGYMCQYVPDKTNNYEVGFKSELAHRALTVEASLFYIDWQQIQIQLTSPAPWYDSFYTNGAAAKSQGVELAVTARPFTGTSIAAWWASIDAVLTAPFPENSPVAGAKGDRLPNSSRDSGNISIEHSVPIRRGALATLGAEFSIVGDRMNVFAADGQRRTLPAYTKLDLRAGVALGTWSANLYINNAADRRGVLDNGIANGLLPNTYIYIQPQTVGVSIAKAF